MTVAGADPGFWKSGWGQVYVNHKVIKRYSLAYNVFSFIFVLDPDS